MQQKLEEIRVAAKAELAAAEDAKAVDELRVRYLGKKGEITAILKQMGSLSAEERTKINYDEPDAFETELLTEHIRRLKSGETVHIPKYDYTRHTRAAETEEIVPCGVIILEGILPQYSGMTVCPKYMLKQIMLTN